MLVFPAAGTGRKGGGGLRCADRCGSEGSYPRRRDVCAVGSTKKKGSVHRCLSMKATCPSHFGRSRGGEVFL